MLGADVVVMTLPEDHAEVKPTVALLERAARDDLRPRALVVVSSPRAWASTTPTHPDGVLTELDEPRRLDVPGIGKASADAERLVLRAARPGGSPRRTSSLEASCTDAASFGTGS